jgi:hypothetical protein
MRSIYLIASCLGRLGILGTTLLSGIRSYLLEGLRLSLVAIFTSNSERMGVQPQHADAFAALTPFQKLQFESNIALEIARARLLFERHKADYSDVSITTLLPITAKLSATDFLKGLNEVFLGGMIVWNAIGLRLDKNPEIKPPSSTPDTEASPPKPT